MNRIVFVLLVVGLLYLPNLFISKLKPRNIFIVNTISAIVLLLLVWIIGPNLEENSIFIALLLTIPIVSNWIREVIKYNKYKNTEVTTDN